jgi:putative tricarboxylic transport membrane protein
VESLQNALDGFAVVLEPTNLLYCLVGVVIGMLIGVLPGLGPAATIAILLPLTYGVEPVTAIIMLAGIFYGAQYGGTITSVLLRLPGEASSVVTVLDGHALARQGRAGTALGVAAVGSFVGGTVAISRRSSRASRSTSGRPSTRRSPSWASSWSRPSRPAPGSRR